MRHTVTDANHERSPTRRAQAVRARRVAFWAACVAGWACGDGDLSAARTRELAPLHAPSPPAAATPEGIEVVHASAVLARAKAPGSRGLVVNAWASWCGSCREEIPMLIAQQKAFAASGLQFVFVSADEPKDFARAAELMREYGGAMPTLAVAPGTRGAFKRAMSPNWRGGVPATFLFDATGKLRHLWEGPILEHEISPVLQGYLAGAAIDGETRTAAQPE